VGPWAALAAQATTGYGPGAERATGFETSSTS